MDSNVSRDMMIGCSSTIISTIMLKDGVTICSIPVRNRESIRDVASRVPTAPHQMWLIALPSGRAMLPGCGRGKPRPYRTHQMWLIALSSGRAMARPYQRGNTSSIQDVARRGLIDRNQNRGCRTLLRQPRWDLVIVF